MQDDPNAKYLIRKGGYFYRPNAEGYTANIAEAGRYTLAEAISYSHPNGPDGPRDGIPAPAMQDDLAGLIERLRAISRRYDKEDGIEDAIKALETLTRERDEARAEVERWLSAFQVAHDRAMQNGAEFQAVCAERDTLRTQLTTTQARLDEAVGIIDSLIDDEPCRYDHHGYCQEHGYLSDGGCGVAHARAFRAQQEGQ